MSTSRSVWLRHAFPDDFPDSPASVLVQGLGPTLDAAVLGLANHLQEHAGFERKEALSAAACMVMEGALSQITTHAGPKAKASMVAALLTDDPALAELRAAIVDEFFEKHQRQRAKSYLWGMLWGLAAGLAGAALYVAFS